MINKQRESFPFDFRGINNLSQTQTEESRWFRGRVMMKFVNGKEAVGLIHEKSPLEEKLAFHQCRQKKWFV